MSSGAAWLCLLVTARGSRSINRILFIILASCLLCVGEYTSSRTRGLRRTKQFRVRDVSFHQNGEILDPSGDLAVLQSATGATLKLTNQKNGVRGSCVHQHAISNTNLCPVRALARRVNHVFSNGGSGDDMLCTFFDHHKERES